MADRDTAFGVQGAPMNAWSRRQQRWVAVGATAVTATFAVTASCLYGTVWDQPDGSAYQAIARGDTRSVLQPFASRQLHALTVRGLSALFHRPIEWAFVLVGVLCLLFLLATVFILMTRTAAPRWVLPAAVCVPIWPLLYVGLLLPDLWYAALLAGLLLLLAQKHYLAAACMMLPLMVSRESSVLTLVCFLIAAWREIRWKGAAVAVTACAAGSLVVHQLVAGGRGNSEGLPQFAYLAGKVPWNLAKNVLGISPWSNLYPELCSQPRWLWTVHLGPIRSLGVCRVSAGQPLFWLDAMFTVFGLLPLLALMLWLRRRPGGQRSVLLRFCVIYGLACFVLAPALGVAVSRLVGYAWPLPLVGLPMLADRLRGGWRAAAFLAVHLTLCGLGLHPFGTTWLTVAAELALWGVGFPLLRALVGGAD
jgi:hypothetical protein